jgi:hypothetical protein
MTGSGNTGPVSSAIVADHLYSNYLIPIRINGQMADEVR